MKFGHAAKVFVAVLAALAISAPVPASDGYEDAPELAGANLAPAALLKGPLHSVAEPVRVENFMGRFDIDSPLGTFRVAGNSMLATRVHELAAIDALNQVNHTEAFQQALARSAAVPFQFVGSAVTNPVGTVENVATGIGTVLGRAGRLVTTSARAVGDSASDRHSSEPRIEAPAAPDGEPVPPSFTGDPFGFNRARREWAKQLNIDPYTTNPVLRPRLDDAARATFAGNFAVNATIGLVVAPLQYAASFDSVVRESVWNLPVIDLVAQNERKLRAMGIEGRPVRDFFRNRWFTPTLQTALVLALEKLPKVKGRDSVIASASTVFGEVRARSFIGAVLLLAQHHRDAPLATVRMSGIVAVGKSRDGELVVATDLDYVWWNAEAAEFAVRTDLAARHRVLLVSGSASTRAVEELGRKHWDVRTGLRTTASN